MDKALTADAILEVSDPNMGLVWMGLLALLIVYKIIDLAASRGVMWWDKKQGNDMWTTLDKLITAVQRLEEVQKRTPPYPQCHYAPDHFDQIEETHRLLGEVYTMQVWQRDMINKGVFRCNLGSDHVRTIERVQDRMDSGRESV